MEWARRPLLEQAAALEKMLAAAGPPPTNDPNRLPPTLLIIMDIGYGLEDGLATVLNASGDGRTNSRSITEAATIVSRSQLAVQLVRQLEQAPWALLNAAALEDPRLTVFGPAFLAAELLGSLTEVALLAARADANSPVPALLVHQVTKAIRLKP